MRIAYLDCPSGISGDMLIAAFVSSGIKIETLKRELSRLKLNGYEIRQRTVKRAGLKATKIDVKIRKGQTERRWADVRNIIEKSSLSNGVKQRAINIFRLIFKAEAKVHGGDFNRIHLHELGAVDCIIDIVGTLVCLEYLRIDRLYCSPINLGSGAVRTDHGLLPVPAPVTCELLRGVTVYSSSIPSELTTPTGSAIVAALVQDFTPLPRMEIEAIGYGAGEKDFKEQPNILRVFIGRSEQHVVDRGIKVIETNIDDMNPQIYEYVIDKLLEKGALDAFITPILMKKTRPASKLTVLSDSSNVEQLTDIIFKETTTFGLRVFEAERRILEREFIGVETAFGRVNVKIGRMGKQTYKVQPEYEECKTIALEKGIPIKEIMDEAKALAIARISSA